MQPIYIHVTQKDKMVMTKMKEGEGAWEFLNLSWKLHQNTFC